jgi:hypothetical protein
MKIREVYPMHRETGNDTINRNPGTRLFLIVLQLCMLPMALAPAYALSAVEVSSFVHRSEVYLGERFIFEIRVRGGATVGTPDFSHLSALFDVEPIDRRYVRYYMQNRHSPEPEADERVYYFRFIGMQTGDLTIGSVPLEVDGKTYLTESHTIRVLEPKDSPLFKLSLSLSKDEAYVGEPVILTVVWSYRDTARYYNYLFPILKHPEIRIGDYLEEGTNDTLVLPFGTGRVPVETGRTRINGDQYESITFRQVLTPQKAGYFQFPRGSVQLWRLKEGYSTSSYNFDSMVVASQGLSLRVIPLPENGRPALFSGLVGHGISVTTSAVPVEVNVGDPITLTISLSGYSSLEEAALPPLEKLSVFKEQFAFISHRSGERMEGNRKIFTRVIRARSPDVLEIPPVELPYFDTETRSYEIAASSPIPLSVRSTRMLLEDDLEGESVRGVPKRVEASKGGINFNYQGTSLLQQDRHASLSSLLHEPLLLFLLIMPPGGFLAVIVLVLLKPGQASRLGARRHRHALRRLQQDARKYETAPDRIKAEALLESCMEFLSNKLGFPTRALTYGDAARVLKKRGIETGVLNELETLFTLHDRSRYGDPEWLENVLNRANGENGGLSALVLRISEELERRIPQ